jgi:hypothetical protein
MFKSSIIVCWQVPYKSHNLPAISRMVLRRSLLVILWTFSTLLPVQSVEGWPENSVFNQSFTTFELTKLLKCLYSPHGIVTESCFEHFMHFQCSFPQFQMKLDWLIDYDGMRLCLRTAATSGPIVHPQGDMWTWRAMVMWCRLEITPDSSTRALWQSYLEQVGGMDEGVRLLPISIWNTSKDL